MGRRAVHAHRAQPIHEFVQLCLRLAAGRFKALRCAFDSTCAVPKACHSLPEPTNHFLYFCVNNLAHRGRRICHDVGAELCKPVLNHLAGGRRLIRRTTRNLRIAHVHLRDVACGVIVDFLNV